jgi:hypothetical protein
METEDLERLAFNHEGEDAQKLSRKTNAFLLRTRSSQFKDRPPVLGGFSYRQRQE